MLTINIDGYKHEWKPSEYTDYELRGKYLIVKNKEQWVGCYNIELNNFWFEVRN